MSNFWESRSGMQIDGSEEKSFLRDFSNIPDNTTAKASIIKIELVEKDNQYTGMQKYYLFTYKLTDGEFMGREVSQKIKVFDGTPEAIDRNLNIFKRLMDICVFKPKHAAEPSVQDLLPMVNGKVGLRIKEWFLEKKDGSGFMEGNHVSEIHKADAEFVTETGIKKSAPSPKAKIITDEYGLESALTRSKSYESFQDSDIPF